MRAQKFLALAAAVIALSVGAWLSGDEPAAEPKKPLDLPPGSEPETDAGPPPLERVRFYGAEYESEAFFWLLDRSRRMSGESLMILAAEVSEAVGQLSHKAEFGFVLYASDCQIWPADGQPVAASQENKDAAIRMLENVSIDKTGRSCMADAAVRLLEMAQKSSRKNKAIIVVGGGAPRCASSAADAGAQTVIDAIVEANPQRVRFDTVLLPVNAAAREDGVALYSRLASLFGGKFTVVQ